MRLSTSNPGRHGFERNWMIFLVAIVYFIAGKLSLLFTIPTGYGTPLFPASGVALASVLLFGWRAAGGVGLGSFLLATVLCAEASPHLALTNRFWLGLGLSFGAVTESVVGGLLIQRFVREPMTITSISDILRFLVLGGPIPVSLGTSISLAALALFGAVPTDTYLYTWWNWWVGDCIGIFIAAPILLSLYAKPRALWKKRIIWTGIPLALVIILYVIVFLQANVWEKKNLLLGLERVGNGVVAQMRKSFEGYVNSLYGLRSVLSVDQPNEEQIFDSVARQWLGLYSGVYDFSWNPRVTRQERDEFIRKARKELPNFEIFKVVEGKIVREAEQEEYYPSRFIVPFRKEDNVAGFNQKSSPERYAPMELSRDHDAAAAIGPVPLIQRVSLHSALIVFLAVYRGEHDTIETRRKNIKGFVKAVFSLEDVVHGSFSKELMPFFRLSIYDDEPSLGRVLFTVGGRPSPPVSSIKFSTPIDLADRRLWLQVTPTEAYLRQERGPGPWIILISGFFMSGLLAAFLLSISGHAFNIEKELIEKKLLTTKLAKSAEELRQSNADLEQFAYVASHDLREPLRTITSYLQLIERRLGSNLDPDCKEFMAFATEGAKRMSVMISALLEYSRVGKGKRSEGKNDLNVILSTTLENLSTSIEESHAKIILGSMPAYHLDYIEGVLLFQNLIGNALKYQHPHRPIQIEISSKKENDIWIFTVKDNGIGIPPENLMNIFLMFKRAHTQKEFPGTGIGLAICKKIVERLGGKIWVESVLGEGSQFFIALPA